MANTSALPDVNLWYVWHLKYWAISGKNAPFAFCGLQKFRVKVMKKDVRDRKEQFFDQDELFQWNIGLSCDRSEINLDLLMHYYKNMKTLQGKGCNIWGAIHLFTDVN